jgi:putative tryptophan/tyrosine transport system substrate-binding protein
MPTRPALLAVSCLGAALLLAQGALAEMRTVAVTAIDRHPALDATYRGIEDALAEAGYSNGDTFTLTYVNAEGSAARAGEIARRLVEMAPDVIVPISTPSAQAVVAAGGSVPVVFAAVTDPLAAKLVGDLLHPGGTVTGVSDGSPIGAHLDLIKEITPEVRRLGVVFNPLEVNALVLLERLEAEAPARGIEIVAAEAPRAGEVEAAARGLIGRADAIYIPTDNTVVAAAENVVALGSANGVPVYAGDTNMVHLGALAALGFNYYDLGRQTGKIVVRVLEGERAGDVSVQGVEITELYLNLAAAKAMGVSLPEAALARAKRIIE